MTNKSSFLRQGLAKAYWSRIKMAFKIKEGTNLYLRENDKFFRGKFVYKPCQEDLQNELRTQEPKQILIQA